MMKWRRQPVWSQARARAEQSHSFPLSLLITLPTIQKRKKTHRECYGTVHEAKLTSSLSEQVLVSLPPHELKLSVDAYPKIKCVFVCFTDAFVGGVIGLLFAYICYRQHYPPFLHMDCHLPYASLAAAAHTPPPTQDDPQPTDNATTLPLEGLTEGPVWLVPTPPTEPPSPPTRSQWLI